MSSCFTLLALLATGLPAKPAPAPDSRAAHARYDREGAALLLPLLAEVIRFPTVAGNAKARLDQQAWLLKTGQRLGFTVKDAGPVTEIELAGPPGAPVLGLLVHGDVQPVEADRWGIPPFEGAVKDGQILGRGAADDKGPLVQALLAMKALRDSALPRSHTIRLLVGSDEESGSNDIPTYLKSHTPPDYSLVLDSAFPVVVGEKAWDALYLTTRLDQRPGPPSDFEVTALTAGQTPSIVPDHAQITLRWKGGTPKWGPLASRLRQRRLPPGIRLQIEERGDQLVVTAHGRAAHGGMNIEGGRNALVALARALDGSLPPGGANDLLDAARLVGQDLYGTAFGLVDRHPLWGRYLVNVATLKPDETGAHRLVINLRRPPPITSAELKARLEAWTASFNKRTGAQLSSGGIFTKEPLVFDPQAKLVRRLMAAYQRQTGSRPAPAIAGGASYAQLMPRSIAFGMWFPGKPYPGHDVDEKMPVRDLHRGAHVLIEALADLACAPPLEQPFRP